jgi:TetR/AcrR family acrAB operon transcriptional repressor
MARKTKKEAAVTRQKIMDAALNVFCEKGYSKTTFVDIAREIGLSKGAVYWHFKTKPELLAAIVAYGEEKQCTAEKAQPIESVADLRCSMAEYTERVATSDETWAFEFFTGFQIEWSTELMAAVHEKLIEMRGDPLKNFEERLLHLQQSGALCKRYDARILAVCFAATWRGAMKFAMYGEYDRQQFIAVVMTGFDLIFDGLAEQVEGAN